MLTGLNHLSLAVADLQRSVQFYESALLFRQRARWDEGAYLSLGDLWLCLSLDNLKSGRPTTDYTHYAFSIAQDDFSGFVEHICSYGVDQWKVNRSEGDSFYFLDPDGHKLEAHVGNLETRLAQCRLHPYRKMEFFD